MASMSASMTQFNCFRHPSKKIEAICTEPFCSGYRFFCVQCFFEQSSHFMRHKSTIIEVSALVEQSHKAKAIQTSTTADLQQGLNRAKSSASDYQTAIKAKHASYMKAIEAITLNFEQMKASLIHDVEEHLATLVQKQHAHVQYLETKTKMHSREASSFADWASMDKSKEAEMTAYFDNIIKAPNQKANDLTNEINAGISAIRRNLRDLDEASNHQMIGYFAQEFSGIVRSKFTELKSLFIVSPSEETPQHQHNDSLDRIHDNHSSVSSSPLSHQSKHKLKTKPDFKTSAASMILSASPRSIKSSRGQQQFIQQQPQELLQQQKQKQNPNNTPRSTSSYPQDFYHIEVEDDSESMLQTSSCTTPTPLGPPTTPINQSHFNCMNKTTNIVMPQSPNAISKHKGQEKANPLHTGGICAMISFQENLTKKIIATGSVDCMIKFWQLESSSFDYIKTLRGHTAPVFALHKIEKANNIFLASASQNGELKIWNPTLNGKELLASFIDHSASILSINVQDEFLITGSMDKTVKVWNLDELFCQQTLIQDESVTGLCCFQRESKKSLVSACGDGFRIWNQKQPGEYKLKSYNNKAHKKGVSCVATVSMNGIDIATAGRDGLIKLWNLEQGICVRQLLGHSQAVYQLFSSEQATASNTAHSEIISTSTDGTIRVWSTTAVNPPQQLVLYENGHSYSDQHSKHGQFVVFDQHRFLLSASNNSNVIKIITLN